MRRYQDRKLILLFSKVLFNDFDIVLFSIILQLLRQIPVLGDGGGDERDVEMPFVEVELGRPMGLGRDRLEHVPPPLVAKGIDPTA